MNWQVKKALNDAERKILYGGCDGHRRGLFRCSRNVGTAL